MRIAVVNRTLVSNRLTVSNGLAVVDRTLIGNGTLLVGDYRTLIGNRALVGHGTLWLTFGHGPLLVSDRARLVGDTGILAGLRLVRYRSTVIGDGPTVVRCVWSVGMTLRLRPGRLRQLLLRCLQRLRHQHRRPHRVRPCGCRARPRRDQVHRRA